MLDKLIAHGSLERVYSIIRHCLNQLQRESIELDFYTEPARPPLIDLLHIDVLLQHHVARENVAELGTLTLIAQADDTVLELTPPQPRGLSFDVPYIISNPAEAILAIRSFWQRRGVALSTPAVEAIALLQSGTIKYSHEYQGARPLLSDADVAAALAAWIIEQRMELFKSVCDRCVNALGEFGLSVVPFSPVQPLTPQAKQDAQYRQQVEKSLQHSSGSPSRRAKVFERRLYLLKNDHLSIDQLAERLEVDTSTIDRDRRALGLTRPTKPRRRAKPQ